MNIDKITYYHNPERTRTTCVIWSGPFRFVGFANLNTRTTMFSKYFGRMISHRRAFYGFMNHFCEARTIERAYIYRTRPFLSNPKRFFKFNIETGVPAREIPRFLYESESR